MTVKVLFFGISYYFVLSFFFGRRVCLLLKLEETLEPKLNNLLPFFMVQLGPCSTLIPRVRKFWARRSFLSTMQK